jgi:beta-N-acetylglucosaminidase
MKKSLLFIISLVILMLSMVAIPKQADGFVKTSVQSARFASVAMQAPVDNRAQILRAFLNEYDSPMSNSAETFIKEADKNNLDWKLVVSIAGVESWFGQRIPYNSYNGWGWGVYGDNVINFASWDAGIETISNSLRTKYMNEWGATDVYTIGSKYAADPAWAQKVSSFMNKLDAYADSYQDQTLHISI